MKKNLLFLSGFLLAGVTALAQCPPIFPSCPANITVSNDPGQCGAVINYPTPVGADTCTAGTRTFTNCNNTGRFGPTITQVTTAYASTSLAGEVKMVQQGYQEWGVPVSGTYTIEAYGAEGGTAPQRPPGKGAYIRGEFNLTAGDTLAIVVGQQGSPINSGGAGGGGGTFVINKLNVDSLVVAGGGAGGNNHTATGYNFSDGGAITNTGTHGGAVGYSAAVSGGGGFVGQGGGTSGGFSFTNGALGGAGPGEGGFGGGGGKGGSTLNGGCGGGGYNGGAGNNNIIIYGGGGSFNAGANQINVADTNSGHGMVVISWSGAPVTTNMTSGQASGTMFPIGTTTVTYVATNSAGSDTCSFTVTVNDTGQATVLGALSQDTICTSSGTLTLPAGTPAGGNYSGAGVTGNTFDPAVAQLGNHWIYYTDTVGCQNADSVLITVVWCTGIDEQSGENLVKVAPNPSNGMYQLHMSDDVKIRSLELYDAVGRKLGYDTQSLNGRSLDLTALPDGLYYLKLKANKSEELFRLIKH